MSEFDLQAVRLALLTKFEEQETVVIADPVGGCRVQIVSSKFEGMSPSARRSIVLGLISDDNIAYMRLLTPTEFSDQGDEELISRAGEDLPLWPEALAGGQRERIGVNLPSSNFEGLAPPVVATFYSLRGGVGRSTAVAHTAYVLARQGLSVLCIDMDLEAPGLASLFGVDDQVVEGTGVVSLLTELEINEPSSLDVLSHVIRVSDDVDLSLLPAGHPSPSYASDLALLDPAAWYRESYNPLRELIRSIRALDSAVRPDVILIDSRTGISPIAAPLLFDVADLAIIAFYPHPQAREGTKLLTRALLAARTDRETAEGSQAYTPEVRFVVSPVPSTPESLDAATVRSLDWVSEWLQPARNQKDEPAFPAVEEIVQVVSYAEAVATADVVAESGQSGPYESIAGWVAGLVDSPRQADAPIGNGGASLVSKSAVLESLQFVGETAEEQSLDVLNEIFVGTGAVRRALSDATPLVIGRKGTGKTLLFRRLAARSGSIPITSATGVVEGTRPWTPNSQFYRAVGASLKSGEGWDEAWMAIIGMSLFAEGIADTMPAGAETSRAQGGDYGDRQLLGDVRTLLDLPDSGLQVREWLIALDRSLDREHLLLFDGLDTGFGIQRSLRDEAVSGLLLVLSDLGSVLQNLTIKVLLREDIWRSITIPNKSHLRARAVMLAWNDHTDFLRIAIRQAWRSPAFRGLAKERLSPASSDKDVSQFNLDTEIEYWPEDLILRAWQLLVGERVAGGKTAFTDKWVWSRLADGNGDHSPRHLVQLLDSATKIESNLEQGNPFSRAIVRPRALVEALDEVSEKALEALREEFAELKDVLAALGRVGNTPLDTQALGAQESTLVSLAEEVGLLETSSSARELIDRYRVPELYRIALGMSRKGQR